MPCRTPLWTVVASVVALLACGSGAETSQGAGGNNSGGTHGGGNDSGGNNSGGSSAGGGELCGGEVCGMGEGCDDIGPNCEELTSAESSCKAIPLDCIYSEDTWEPVCTCNGVVRPFDCSYFSATSLDHCDQIECGGETCDKATEYCEVTLSDPYNAAHACKPIPTACGATPTCACMSNETCGQSCQGAAESGFKLVCGVAM